MQPVRNPNSFNTIRAGGGGMGKSGSGITVGGRGGDVLISHPVTQHISHVYHCYSDPPLQNPVIPICYTHRACGTQFAPRMCPCGDQYQSWARPLSECHCTVHTDPRHRSARPKTRPRRSMSSRQRLSALSVWIGTFG
ncbi:hypothetical protein BS47DRAFT_1381864 [Hydnum rufescens UP504]|uniref:Uncharacterized protein n=1 Tax=Hydnum rufescens UP504 TaxID=1448309 RepID=A0A9P6DXK4_9AGAM|nr:hypothetical protein BS47DRAFT_1381864 [Hydnum rufescens UP504]